MQPSLPFFPEAASSMAHRVDALFFFLLGVSGFIALGICVGIIYFALKYHRKGPNEIGEQITGSAALEITWMVIPFILAMVMFGWGASIYVSMRRPPDQALEVYAVGKQWMWKLQHVEGPKEINELHVPVNRVVKLTMASEDVIHDFFIPAFRVKMDVVPGRYQTLWFKATQPGRYHLFCSQYCGTNHALMGGWVTVMEPDAYEAWLSGGPAEGSLSDAGAKLFAKLACQNCHTGQPTGRGPSLNGVFGSTVLLSTGEKILADESYIRESILKPNAKIVAGYEPQMPTFQGLVSEEQLLQLIAYIKSLAPPAPGQSPETPAAAGAPGRPPSSQQTKVKQK
jgi:cytochrome c oxidase subunit II